MPTPTLHATAYGRPATALLRERISAAKAGDPLRPVTVVVPTNYVGVSARRLLASGALGPISDRGDGIAGLTLLTVYRLAELLGAPPLAAAKRRPVSTPVVAAAVRGVLADAPGMFAPVRDHPATEAALVRVHRELSEVGDGSLDTLAGCGARARDVVRIHRAVRSRLEGCWYEEADLMAAARVAVAGGSPVVGDLGTVVVHLPQDLSVPAAGLLRALAGATTVEVIAAFTGSDDADADVRRTLDRLGAPAPASIDVAPPTATAVVSTSDAEEEVRTAVGEIVAAARDGVPLEAIAVLYPSPEPYARMLHEQLAAAGIASNGRAVRPLAERLAGRWLLDLLRLPDRRFARPAVMSLLTEAPVRGDGGRPLPTTAWERITRDAGVVRGEADWTDRLRHHADGLRAAADAAEQDQPPRHDVAGWRRHRADRTDQLREFVGELLDALHVASTMTGWGELVGWCRDAVTRYLGDHTHRSRWPQVERDAADRLDVALERLAGLDEVEPATDLAVFRRTLELELDADLGRVGEFGRGVLVGTPSAALGVDLEVVVVLGLAEGVLPTRPREDSLLADAERETVAAELPPRSDRTGLEHRHLLAALASARRTRVLTVPRGDLRRSVERVGSRWLDEVAAEAPTRTVPSFAARMQSVAFPTTRRQYALRALAVQPRAELARHPLVAADPALRRGVRLLQARRSDAFTRFDGNLGGVRDALAPPVGEVVSASRLEAWLRCPHAYLMKYLLRVHEVDNPEQVLAIGHMERGLLIHDVLEAWLRECLAEGVPDPDEPWPASAVRRMGALGVEACDAAEAAGITGHPLLWRRDRARILHDLERFVAHDAERRAERGLVPRAAELSFGMRGDGARPPLEIDLGDGRSIRVRGRIDRVDRDRDGAVVVADYKAGSDYAYRDLGPDRPLGDGTKLQLPIYGLAVRGDAGCSVTTEYWFTSTKRGFRRIGYLLTDDVVDQLRHALRLAVDGIAAGRFPQRPPEPGWSMFTECLYCDPDELGTADRHRRWERLRHAPQLADYVAHVEPDALAGDEATEDDTEVGA